jgi:hypothetical protein
MGKCASKHEEIELQQQQIEQQQKQLEIKLQHLFESIYDAAIKAQDNVQLNNMHYIFSLIPQNEEGIHIAKTIKIRMPIDGLVKDVDIPLITLLNPKSVSFSEMKIKTNINMNLLDIPIEKIGQHEIQKTEYELNIDNNNNKNNLTNIEMIIKFDEPVEMYNRILSKYESVL